MIAILQEILTRRNLIRELVLKDLKIRYSRSALHFIWVFLAPFILVAIFYFVFSLLLRVRIEGVPFPLYLMTAIFSWRFFQDSLIASTTSLVDNRNLIKESSFPHYFIPLAIVISNFIIFLPSLLITLACSIFYLKGAPACLLFLPLVLALHLSITASLAIICSIIYVRLRDTKYITEMLVTLLFYLTPAFYSLELVSSSFPGLLFKVYAANPFVGILNMYRFTLLRGFSLSLPPEFIYYSVITPVIFCILIFGLCCCLYKVNKNINDYISW
jgi:ABC-type polysaccharide/polyol phosphate export permease